MTAWTTEELEKVENTDELDVSSYRRDGSLRPFVTIWGVRVGDGVYVRSAYGRENGWFRRALASGNGRVRVGDVEKDVTYEEPGPEVHDALDTIYREKYGRYAQSIVSTVVGPEAARATFRLIPREA